MTLASTPSPSTATPLPTGFDDYAPQQFSLANASLSAGDLSALKKNVEIVRDTIIFITALSGAKGLGGHTGGPYDMTPEALIVEGFINGGEHIDRALYDEAGHRVALQYVMAALRGDLDAQSLWHYREAKWRLPGHPERGYTPGVAFSSGRLGHLWAYVNGVAMQDRARRICLFGSDGSQQEGDNAEAARIAVQQKLNVKLFIDDNNITIAGHPSDYLGTFDLRATLEGHGLPVADVDGEDLAGLYAAMQRILASDGPGALLIKRKIALGVPNIEDKPAAHDVIKAADAIAYFEERGNAAAAEMIRDTQKLAGAETYFFPHHAEKKHKNRDAFGKIVCDLLERRPRDQITNEVLVVDSDLEGSCGLHHIRKAFPEVYVSSGIMERGNFSLAAGFGAEMGRQGIFGTFAAFAEMTISELTMARLNQANVLCHYSHSGVDDIADNTCHFGINNFFLDGGVGENDTTHLFSPADENQLRSLLEETFYDAGIRVIMTTRSAVPAILTEEGEPFYAADYKFRHGADEIIRKGTAGWVVSYGEMLHRALDAVDKLRAEGFDVGLINKAHLSAVDDESLAMVGGAPFVALFETQNRKTGLGVRYGAALMERGATARYRYFGVTHEGCGGLGDQIIHQGLDSQSIHTELSALLRGE